ncbi:MAG: DUF1566 domain-containing protein [Bacillota bacterium]
MKVKKQVLGWLGVIITLLLSGLWSYWGAYENFHEGWYSTSVWENILMLIFQYMLFPIIFTLLAMTIMKWKIPGIILHGSMAVFCYFFFSGASFDVLGLLIIIPFIILGLLYYYGEPNPKKWAYRLILIVPLVIFLSISIPQGIRVSQRVNDGDFGMRAVEGNGLTLVWAPRGPGWPDEGTSWEEAQYICKHLSEDGLTVMDTEQNIWRLPTVDEAVRSMSLHGENSGGVWREAEEKAVYSKTPDKETPLWDVHSKIIYYWTSDTSRRDEKQAYIIVYHGGVYDRRKTDRYSYLSFRAVKDADSN